MREVSADEHLPFGRRLRGRFEIDFDLFKASAENALNLLVAVGELAKHLAQQPGDLLIGQRHHAGGDSPRALIGGGKKRAHEHARTIRSKGWPDAFGVKGGCFQNESRLRGGRVGRMSGTCIGPILPRKDRIASIDFAVPRVRRTSSTVWRTSVSACARFMLEDKWPDEI